MDFDFTDDEIREELRKLGYINVPSSRLVEFRRDLEALIHSEKSSEIDGTTDSEANLWTDQSEQHFLPHDQRVERKNIGTSNNTRSPLGPFSYGDVPDSTSVHYPRPANTALLGAGNRLNAGPTTGASNRPVKRKVLRRGRDGLVEVSESTTGSEADDMSYIEDRLNALSTRLLNADDDERSKDSAASPRQHTGVTGRHTTVHQPDRVNGGSVRSKTAGRGDATCEGRPQSRAESVRSCQSRASVVHSMTSEPHTRGWTRCDPVSCYQRYKSGWDSQKAPGERAHKDLRWAVRERMVYHDPIVEKRQRNYRPNSYIVPTDKKRKTLRWQIREDLAQGVVRPASVLY